MLRKLGGGASPSRRTPSRTSSSNHHRHVGTDHAAGFYHRATHTDHHQSSGPGRDPDPANAHQSGTNADRRSTAKPKCSDGALPDFARNSNRAERNGSRHSCDRHNRRSTEPITKAGISNFEFADNTIE